MNDDYFDTNVLIYAASGDEDKASIADGLLAEGGTVSVQVLNEFANATSRRGLLTWPQIEEYLGGVRLALRIVPVDIAIHQTAVRLLRRCQLSFYDACHVAAALSAGCDRLWSEDMHHGLKIDGKLQILNPFRSD